MGGDPPAEDEVGSREWRAVVPGETGTEPIDRLHATVGEDAPGLGVQLRQLGGQERARRPRVVHKRQLSIEHPPERVERRLRLPWWVPREARRLYAHSD